MTSRTREPRDCQHAKPHQHGTWQAHKEDRCHCDPCRVAWNRYCKITRHWRAQGRIVTVPAVGVSRRLRALARLGWSSGELAARLGITRQAVEQLRAAGARTVTPETRQRIDAMYNQLSLKRSQGRYALKTVRHAERQGWLPPMAWDDDTIDDPAAVPYASEPVDIDPVAVEEALTGRPVALTRVERAEVVRVGTERGLSAKALGLLLGTSDRTVQRGRAA